MEVYQSEFQGATIDARLAAVATMQTAISNLETAVAAKYSKPSSGIPETDLDAAVQSALALARTAVQSLSDYYNKAEIDALLAAVNSQEYVDVSTLPTASASTLGKIYLVGPDANNQYARYYTSYNGSAYSWVAAGSTEINLANYATKAELDQLEQAVIYDESVEIEPVSVQDGLYISSYNGTTATYNGYRCKVYKVEDLVGVQNLVLRGTNRQGYMPSKIYGFYNSISTFDNSTAVSIGPGFDASETEWERGLTIPSGAVSLLVVEYSTTISQEIVSFTTSSVKDRISEIEGRLLIQENRLPLYPTTRLDGKYIVTGGNLSSYNGYFANVYNVEGIKKVYIKINKGQNLVASKQYAFYSAENIIDSTTCVLLGPTVNDSVLDGSVVAVDVPSGAKILLLVNYTSAVLQFADADMDVPLEDVVVEMQEVVDSKVVGKYAVEWDGENLLAAYLKGSVEYCYWFKKCLANDLFTFYLVGYRSADGRTEPMTDHIMNDASIKVINRAYSDNIGPVSMSVGSWVGGNHTYNNGGTVKTAKTDSVSIYADGQLVSAAMKSRCDSIIIKVVNTLYDPAIAPAAGAEILSTVLATETEVYSIVKNNIEVSVNIQFVSSTSNNVALYYGMQSNADGETGVLTPNGQYAGAFALPANASFTKQDYPDFNRFVEKKDGVFYQATYLLPNKDGNHGLLSGTGAVFSRSDNKDYHHIVYSLTAAGARLTWSGVYTFMDSPIVDNANVLAYMGVVNGKDTIFIAAKQACAENIVLPSEYSFHRLELVEKVGAIDTANVFVDVDGIRIDATGTGSLILTL